jgi:hypothetical protein
MKKFILSENEIRNLVKRTLLKEEGENKTISQLQSLLANKGFTEVGTADGKAGPNTLSAINRALNLGLNLYKPQQAVKQQQVQQKSTTIKDPSNLSDNNTTQLAGDNTLKGIELNPQNPNAGINVEPPKYQAPSGTPSTQAPSGTQGAKSERLTTAKGF